MARDHSRIKVSIWDDKDFLRLRQADQHTYFAFTSNRSLSRCGVLTFICSRFEDLASDITATKLRASVKALCEARFVVLDERTQELLVRSHVRHDGVLDRLNMGKATGTAFETVHSDLIRRAIGDELARLMREKPDLLGWKGLAVTSPTAYAMASGMESGKS